MADGPRVRVVSYNIHSLRDDRSALTEVVRALAPDVLVVQEALRWVDPRTWCIDLARRFGLARAAGGLAAQGNAVLTAAGVTVEQQRFVRYPLAFGHYPRGAVFLRCSVGRSVFVVAGSHLSPDAAMRLRQARIFKAALNSAVAEADAPALVGIDMNETSTGEAWLVVSEGLVDAAEATGQAGVATFPTGGPVERIDAIFVDPRCSLLGYRAVDTPQSRAASDHFPVLCDVALPSA